MNQDTKLFGIMVLLAISLMVLFSVVQCSAEEDTAPPPSIVTTPKPEPEPTPATTQYTLTVTAGEGGTVSTDGGTYDEGTSVTITATPYEGYEFVGWEGSESDSSSLSLTLNGNTTVQALFAQLPVLILPPSPSKMFTKGVADTLSIGFTSASGYKSVSIEANYGTVEVLEQPEKGVNEGNIVIQYTPLSIENVDFLTTIAGEDTINISIEDLKNISNETPYKLRTQPEPKFENFNVDSRISMKYNPNELLIQKIRYLNQIDNAYFDNCVDQNHLRGGFNRWGNIKDDVGIPTYIDLNNDGYFDIVLAVSYQDGGMENYQIKNSVLELYLYKDGNFIYSKILEEHSYVNPFKIIPGDFDLDGDADLYILNSGRDVTPYPGDISVILENNFINENFIEHKIGQKLFTHAAALVDIDNDGDLDIYESGNKGLLNYFSGFYINQGSFKFEEKNNYIDGSNGLNSIFLTSEFNDLNNDGFIDKIGTYTEFSVCPEYLPSGVENCPDFSPIILWGDINNKLLFENSSRIPKVEGYGVPLNIFFHDLDNDDLDEIIISRRGGAYWGDPNFYRGYYIQICKLNVDRSIIDVTENFIENFKNSEYMCIDNNIGGYPHAKNMFDLKNDGLIDLFGSNPYDSNIRVRWEWNGSKFIKVSP